MKTKIELFELIDGSGLAITGSTLYVSNGDDNNVEPPPGLLWRAGQLSAGHGHDGTTWRTEAPSTST